MPRSALAQHVDPQELATFERLAEQWWNPQGPLRMLHRMNPARLRWVVDVTRKELGLKDGLPRQGLAGVRALDIGCGGGLLCEPLARMGAKVTGLDASARAIAAARAHADAAGVDVSYRLLDDAETDLSGQLFDLVLALEVIEHTADPEGLIQTWANWLRPGGIMILSTLNRTMMARLLAVYAAESLLDWAEPGSHDWRRFIRPHELARMTRRAGLRLGSITGLRFDPFTGSFLLDPSRLGINYMLWAKKEG